MARRPSIKKSFPKSKAGKNTKSSAKILAVDARQHCLTLRACDCCRLRKIKCDGNTPCSTCEVYKRVCKYELNGRPTYAGPVYVESLESKILALRSLLHQVSQQLDTKGLDFDKKLLNQVRLESRESDSQHALHQDSPLESLSIPGDEAFSEQDELLDTTIEATNRLQIDRKGQYEYHGDFAGLAFLRQIGEKCSQLLNVNVLKRAEFSHLPLQEAFSSADFLASGLRIEPITITILPDKATAKVLSKVAVQSAYTLMNFIHWPSFERSIDQIYSTRIEDYTDTERTFLPLLYVTLAIGELFSIRRESNESFLSSPIETMGGAWFRVGQAILGPPNCRDITSLQAIISIVIYLQSSALMNSCYSYISVGIAIALQMGLHRASTSSLLDSVQREVRRRTFWVLQTMEGYVATVLGLPTILDEEDVDQDFPMETAGFMPISPGEESSFAANNAHIRLLIIMRRVVKEIYPRVKPRGDVRPSSYKVSFTSIVQIEADLNEWFSSALSSTPDEAGYSEALRAQLLLRLAYAHVQMVLYRPFIHHIVRTQQEDPLEMRSYACASACVKAAMQIIWLVEELSNRGLLFSAYWFTAYITFFAVMALCMFIIGNPNDPTVDETLKAAEKGRNVLSRLALDNRAAERCVASLGGLFDKISLLHIERRHSRESVASSASSNLPADLASHQALVDPVSFHPQDQVSFPMIAEQPAPEMTIAALFLPVPASTSPQNAPPESGFLLTPDALPDTNTQPNLSAKTYPSLDGFSLLEYDVDNDMNMVVNKSATKDSSEDQESNAYFHYFQAGWIGQGDMLGPGTCSV